MPAPPLRLYLDAGVIIQGCFTSWGASKALLVLTTLREHYTVVLADSIWDEVQDAINRRAPGTERAEAREAVNGWLARVRVERWPLPSDEELQRHFAAVLPVLRHQNDLVSVVTAIQAQPAWILSTNTEHWGPALALRTGLRIATPLAFLEYLSTRAAGDAPA